MYGVLQHLFFLLSSVCLFSTLSHLSLLYPQPPHPTPILSFLTHSLYSSLSLLMSTPSPPSIPAHIYPLLHSLFSYPRGRRVLLHTSLPLPRSGCGEYKTVHDRVSRPDHHQSYQGKWHIHTETVSSKHRTLTVC